MYDYRLAMHEDVENAIRENFPRYWDCSSREELEEKANDELWVDDSVTGNGSGSYTFNRAKAGEYVIGNEALIEELVSEFCIDAETVAKHLTDWEYWDVSIRCYLLSGVIAEVLDGLEDELFPDDESDEGAEEE